MKTTAATISKDHANFLKTFEADQVELKIEGKPFVGLKENLNQETRATLWGFGEGFELIVSIDVGETNVKIVEKMDVDAKIDGEWKDLRVKRIESHSGTVYKVMLNDRYKA
jgi:hypothetical protein